MKILILSCNTGEGHNSCAKALQIAMQRRGITCEIQDTLALVSEGLSQQVGNAYLFSTRGSLFEFIYKLGGFVSDNIDAWQSLVYGANRLYARKLYDHITNNHFDVIVCVHLFPAEAITALKRNMHLEIPSYFIMTDYTCIPFLQETDLDYYIIPHEHLIEEFVDKGLPREKILPIGIPVDEKKFSTRMPKNKARAQIMQSISNSNLRADGHWYLVMSGSMGFGNVEDLILQLLHDIQPEDTIICVCGRNESLLHSLHERFAEYRQLCLLGFSNQVSVLMDASDVLFTKPGGITSTEAIVKNIPIIHTRPIPGLENHNAHFFHLHGMSYFTTNIHQQVAVAKRLCQDSNYRKQMLQNQRMNANPHSSDDVINLILEDKNRLHKPFSNNET
jgi:processive 1,2-diacylglycerol beta-glucosyltransferase